MLAQGEDIVPLVGFTRPSRIADNMAALDVVFTSDEQAELLRAFAPDAIVGARYPDFVLKWAAQ